MSIYIGYELDKNTTILVEAPEGTSSGVVKASRAGEVACVKAKKTFREALKDIKTQARMLVEEIDDLHVDEAEIKFGINTVGEVGNMAIGKIGVGVNYEVTLKWKKPMSKE